jgi:glucose/arabinose dehydrogenase
MRNHLLRTTSAAFALLGGIALATAQQQPPPPAEPQQQQQQQQQQEKAQQTPSGQMGKEEPSSHAPSSKPQNPAVLVNGALAVPGAAPDIDTVPAKFSEQNAADDKLITIGYTFKNLSDEQRRTIHQALKGQPVGSAFNADLGVQLPASVELRPLPGEITGRVPQTAGYQYAVAADRVLLVSPVSRVVVGVFPEVK